ncbi:MAG: pantetheine-phosphate adenylyltransferase [Muribaculaceae bacterium]|nr:pantetheine-phosphate adenylyltransferase [Muribaculaceae bacterium]
MSTAVYAGSFDPFTIGHKDIVNRALQMFDRVVIAIGVNEHKKGLWPAEFRCQAIAAAYRDCPEVKVITYTGLTVDMARDCGADVLIRGVRNTADFAFEQNLADTNRALTGIDTVLLITSPSLAFVSSSMVRELMAFGHDASRFIAWTTPSSPE